MTAQLETLVRFEGEEWTLLESSGELFDIDDLDLSIGFHSTACWDGYLLTFAISDGKVVLAELRAEVHERPVVLGVPPSTAADAYGFAATYLGMNHELAYSGTVLIANDLLERGLPHEVFRYQQVREVFVASGRVESVADRSTQVLELREQMARSRAAFVPTPEPQNRSWLGSHRYFDDLAGHTRGTFYWRYFEQRYKRHVRGRDPRPRWFPSSDMDKVHVFTSTGRFSSLADARAFAHPSVDDTGRTVPSPLMIELRTGTARLPRIEVVHLDAPTKLRALLQPAPFSFQWAGLLPPKAKADTAICVFEPPKLQLQATGSLVYVGPFFYSPDGPTSDD